MAYTSWSVVFGEQPSAAKWNILGTNDASFNDGTGIADGVILPEHLLNGASALNTWAWDSWTPTLSGRFDDADWTKAAKYIQIGKTVFFRMKLVATAAAPMGGGSPGAIFTLPVTAANLSPTSEFMAIGWGSYLDSGTGAGFMIPTFKSTTTAEVRTSPGTITTSTVPITWTTNDEIFIMGVYEAA